MYLSIQCKVLTNPFVKGKMSLLGQNWRWNMDGDEDLKKLLDIYTKMSKEWRYMWISYGNLMLAAQQAEKKVKE